MQRIHKNKSDYGIKDYYEFYIKEYDTHIEKIKYNKIITEFNKEIVNFIIEENMVYSLPYIGLQLLIMKDKRKPRIVNGRLINNIPVNWKATKELWEKNEEAREKKLRVRHINSHTSGYVFRIYLKKFKSKFKYKSIYKFRPNRLFKRKLASRIKDLSKDTYDSFLLYKNK